MIRKLKNKGGETITETIIAVSILAIGITFSSTLMLNSLRNINVSKNRFVAVNIAREGIEAMRSIRDTNWLKFSGDQRACWNHMPQDLEGEGEGRKEYCKDDDGDGVSDTPITPGDYIIYKDTDHRWRLASAVDENGDSTTPLFTVDINGNGEFDMYNHLIEGALIAEEGADPKTTIFKREITIQYLADEGEDGNTTNNRMVVTSRVSWPGVEKDKDRFTELKTHLTDYFGRDNLES